MRIASADLLWHRTALKRPFRHAAAARHHADRILLLLHDDDGRSGFGEIMPRAYVTGETFEAVFDITAPRVIDVLLGRHFHRSHDLYVLLNDIVHDGEVGLALAAGLEAALINLFEQHGKRFDYAGLLGPKRSTLPIHVATIGLGGSDVDLKRRALEARLGRARQVKIKVAGVDDAARLHELHRYLGDVPIRLDANGALDVDQASQLLDALTTLPVIALEQPFAPDLPDLGARLTALHERFSIPLMADESVCSMADLRRCIDHGGYQIVNLRLGKCGGLIGTAALRDAALAAGLEVVGGTLVGESVILDRAARIFLGRSEAVPFIEGLGQHRWLLEIDPVSVESLGDVDDGEQPVRFSLDADRCEEMTIARRSFPP